MSFLFASLVAAASPACQPVTLEGLGVLGFEASYLIPSQGHLANRKVWLPHANLLATYFDQMGLPRTMWRRARVKVKGCLANGHFGHLGAYEYQLLSFSIVS